MLEDVDDVHVFNTRFEGVKVVSEVHGRLQLLQEHAAAHHHRRDH